MALQKTGQYQDNDGQPRNVGVVALAGASEAYDLIVNAGASVTSSAVQLTGGYYGLTVDGTLGSGGSVQLQRKNGRTGDWHPVGAARTTNDDGASPPGGTSFQVVANATVRAVFTAGTSAAGVDVSIGRLP